MLQPLHLLSSGQGVSYLACLGPHHLRLQSLGVHTAPPSHASAGLGAAPLPPPPSRSGHGGIGPRHSLQPPSFFRLGTTTKVDLEVIEPVVGVGDDSLSIHASDAEDGHLISEAEAGESTSPFVASQFAAFSQDIALPVEEKAPALPPDMAECFNSSFQGDQSGLAKVRPS